MGIPEYDAAMKLRLFPIAGFVTHRRMLEMLAVTVFLSGLCCAGYIWIAQDRLERQAKAEGVELAGAVAPEDSRRYAHDTELYYGKTGLLVEGWKRSLGVLTHGKGLALTIGMVSLVMAVGIYYFAGVGGRKTED
jgi:hypothetical protein